MAKDESKKEKKARRKSEAVGDASAMSVDAPEPSTTTVTTTTETVETPSSKKEKKEKKVKKEKDDAEEDGDEINPEAISPIARECDLRALRWCEFESDT